MGYYSLDVGEWHIVALNSQLCKNKTWYPRTRYVHNLPRWGCYGNRPEHRWLERDLKANSDATCTMALMHHPMYKWRTGRSARSTAYRNLCSSSTTATAGMPC